MTITPYDSKVVGSFAYKGIKINQRNPECFIADDFVARMGPGKYRIHPPDMVGVNALMESQLGQRQAKQLGRESRMPDKT